MYRPFTHSLAALIAFGSVSACSTTDRLARIGEEPPLSEIHNPVAQRNYRPVTQPMPEPRATTQNPNSLWRAGAKSFFDDQRAKEVGDLLTVSINIDDSASVDNSTTRSRSNSEDANMTNMLGIEGSLGNVLPDAINPSQLVNLGSNSSVNISLTVAAIVTQELPNGNLVIQGRQEVRVNHEVRELLITGIIRPEDVSNTNTIEHTQIAEARISYGGRGVISDVQKPRYGQELYDILMPF